MELRNSNAVVNEPSVRQYVVSPDFAKTWILLQNGDKRINQKKHYQNAKGDTTWKV